MSGFVVIDDKGWVQEIHTGDFGPDGSIVVIDHDLICKIKTNQLTTLYDGEQFCQVKNPKDIWKRMRISNLRGASAEREYRHYLSNLDSAFPDIPSGMVIDKSEAVKKLFDPSFEMEFKPGLKICQSTEDDIEIWEQSMVESGLYTKDEAWGYAAQWLSDTSVWNVKVVWKDRILQLENYHLGGIGSNTVTNGFQTHIDRTRPQWFYQQMGKPVLKALYAEGFETVIAQVRKDRPDWASYLAEVYGSEILKTTDKAIILRTKIKDSLALIGDWPKRRTLGTDWKWEKGGIFIREATEIDFPAIRSAINESWGDDPQKEFSLQTFDERWNLDQAAILLSYENDKMIDARAYRQRKDSTISYVSALLRSPLKQSLTDKEIILTGYLEWQKAVGYKISSFMLNSQSYSNYKNTFSRRGWTVHSEKDGLTEARLNIEEVLSGATVTK